MVETPNEKTLDLSVKAVRAILELMVSDPQLVNPLQRKVNFSGSMEKVDAKGHGKAELRLESADGQSAVFTMDLTVRIDDAED